MRRLCADREEKRVTRGSDISGQDGEQEQLDLNDPNQRSLLERRLAVVDKVPEGVRGHEDSQLEPVSVSSRLNSRLSQETS
jgi:hypothetical protein